MGGKGGATELCLLNVLHPKCPHDALLANSFALCRKQHATEIYDKTEPKQK